MLFHRMRERERGSPNHTQIRSNQGDTDSVYISAVKLSSTSDATLKCINETQTFPSRPQTSLRTWTARKSLLLQMPVDSFKATFARHPQAGRGPAIAQAMVESRARSAVPPSASLTPAALIGSGRRRGRIAGGTNHQLAVLPN